MLNALKSLSTPTKVVLALAVAGLLACLALLTPSARSALTYVTNPYSAEFQQSELGVTLVEKTGDPAEGGDTEWRQVGTGEQSGQMLPAEALLGSTDGYLEVGEEYDEQISAQNNSSTPEYVRLTIRAYWATPDNGETDARAAKNPAYDPAFIELTRANQDKWFYSKSESNDERQVFYLYNQLQPGEIAAPAISKITVLEALRPYLSAYKLTNVAIDAQVDSVQTGNAVEAAKSAWGVDVGPNGLNLGWGEGE